MNIQFYYEKLQNSKEYQKFVKENPKAFLCSGFFIIDKKGSENKQHFDFYCILPSNKLPTCSRSQINKNFFNDNHVSAKKSDEVDFEVNNERDVKQRGKLFSFELENNCNKVEVEQIGKKVLEKLELSFDFDFKEIEKLILDKMNAEKMNSKIEKMLFSLQNIKGKNMLIGTIFISMFGLLQVHVDVEKNKVILFEKKSFFDMIKVVKK